MGLFDRWKRKKKQPYNRWADPQAKPPGTYPATGFTPIDDTPGTTPSSNDFQFGGGSFGGGGASSKWESDDPSPIPSSVETQSHHGHDSTHSSGHYGGSHDYGGSHSHGSSGDSGSTGSTGDSGGGDSGGGGDCGGGGSD